MDLRLVFPVCDHSAESVELRLLRAELLGELVDLVVHIDDVAKQEHDQLHFRVESFGHVWIQHQSIAQSWLELGWGHDGTPVFACGCRTGIVVRLSDERKAMGNEGKSKAPTEDSMGTFW